MTPADEVNGACVHVADARHVTRQGCSQGMAIVIHGGAYEERARGSIQDGDRVAAGSLLRECLDNSAELMIAKFLPWSSFAPMFLFGTIQPVIIQLWTEPRLNR